MIFKACYFLSSPAIKFKEPLRNFSSNFAFAATFPIAANPEYECHILSAWQTTRHSSKISNQMMIVEVKMTCFLHSLYLNKYWPESVGCCRILNLFYKAYLLVY